jgi:hypothetical protein
LSLVLVYLKVLILLSQLGSLESKAKSSIVSRLSLLEGADSDVSARKPRTQSQKALASHHSLLEGPDSAVSSRKPRTQNQKHLPLVIVYLKVLILLSQWPQLLEKYDNL